MRTTSNPAFRNLPRSNAANGQYASNVGFYQGQQSPAGYGAPQLPSAAADRAITVDDVVIKTGISLAVALATGAVTAIWSHSRIAELGNATSSIMPIVGVMLGGMLVGLALALVMIFRRKPSGPLTLAYSAAEGVFLGALTGVFEAIFPGIALQAILGTAGVFIAMLITYKTGAIKVTPRLTKWIIGATAGVVILLLANLVLGLFGVDLGLRSGGPVAIIFSLVVIGIAAFSLLLDFEAATELIRTGAPAKWAWFAAFGLMTTLVWLYFEILQLLSYLQGD